MFQKNKLSRLFALTLLLILGCSEQSKKINKSESEVSNTNNLEKLNDEEILSKVLPDHYMNDSLVLLMLKDTSVQMKYFANRKCYYSVFLEDVRTEFSPKTWRQTIKNKDTIIDSISQFLTYGVDPNNNLPYQFRTDEKYKICAFGLPWVSIQKQIAADSIRRITYREDYIKLGLCLKPIKECACFKSFDSQAGDWAAFEYE